MQPTGPRAIVVHGFIAVVLGWQLFDVVTGREHWPFSPYGMYSFGESRTTTRYRIYGMASARELSLEAGRYFRPFDASRLSDAFEEHLLGRADSEATTRRALENLYEVYERGRRTRRHDGPRLDALRLYRLQWHADPTLANKDRPDSKELVHELAIAQ